MELALHPDPYRIVDAQADAGPALLALERVDGAYVDRCSADHHRPVTVERPFPVTIAPARLRD